MKILRHALVETLPFVSDIAHDQMGAVLGDSDWFCNEMQKINRQIGSLVASDAPICTGPFPKTKSNNYDFIIYEDSTQKFHNLARFLCA